jgi:hypothetical protein
MDGTTIDTIVTTEETKTLNQTIVHLDPHNATITHTTPVFTWVPVAGTTVTLDAGPTYVAFVDIYGGLDFGGPMETDTDPVDDPLETGTLNTEPATADYTCDATVHEIAVWPTVTAEYSYFIQTFASDAPSIDPEEPISLPPALIGYLKDRHDIITTVFNGSDIATCTLQPTKEPTRTIVQPTLSGPPPEEETSAPYYTPPPSPVFTQTTSSYISKTYESTSTHVTVRSCLRCQTQNIPVPGVPTGKPEDKPGDKPEDKPEDPPQQRPKDPPQSQNNPEVNRPQGPTDLPGLIASILNDPQFTGAPQVPNNNNNEQNDQRVTIGDSVLPIKPAILTQGPNQENNPNNQQTQINPGVVIGSETLTPGQTTTMNGVEIIVPSQGGGSSIIVGGSTIGVQPAGPTGPPVLTVGDNTVTANSQGQFVVGGQTLTPGGPPVTVDGSTLSLGPSGTIAVVNGVTQTLGNSPFTTGAPVLTVGDQTISATVIGGSTQFVVGPGQTLTPGGVLTVDGTTFSMPADGSGSTVVVNGVTSTLSGTGLPVITAGTQSVTASVIDGTTAFVVGDKTLTPGGVVTVDGTTISMPESASGSVVVINGVTSTLGQPSVTSAPALTINGKTYSATVRDGTTEYSLGPGTTLKPGEAITVSGTTYSLDSKGTALVINGKTSSIPKLPATNSATTTGSASKSASTSDSSSSTTTQRQPGNFIASGIGITDKPGSAARIGGGVDKWAEGMIIGLAGWLLVFV